MGILGRILDEQPPEIPAGATVLLEDELEAGVGGGTWCFRPYWVMLDAGHQEVGERHYLRRQVFADQNYANAWCAWVQSRGALPAPEQPTGAE